MSEQTLTQSATYERLCQVIPGGVNSPVRAFKGLDHPPMVAHQGIKDCVIDVEGNKFVDYCCSWGALVHGHAHPKILEAAKKRMELGTTFGITSEIEGELAQVIVDSVPSLDQIRFVSSGTEATMSAARLARGYTGKEIIVKFAGNYHGHADFFLVQAGSGVTTMSSSSSAGIPEAMVQHMACLPYNDTAAALRFLQDPAHRDNIAAVILEPIAANMGVVPASHSFLEMLREETAKMGAVLIFDEVISGFRVGREGAQGYYGIESDMTCFGKIVGGGFPAAAFGGKRAIMEYLAPQGPVYQAGTLSGNPVAMAAGLQSLALLSQEGVYEELERKTNIITEPVKDFLLDNNSNACIQQVGSLFTLFFGKKAVNNFDDAKALDLTTFAEFFRFMYQNGIYVSPSQHEAWFISTVHEEEHLEKTRDLILEFLKKSM